MNIRGLILIMAGLTFCSRGWTQTLSIDMDNAPFNKFVREIESKTNFRFYYDQSWIDTLKVTIHANNVEVDSLLAESLKPLDLNFAMSFTNEIFITKNKSLITALPGDFFDKASTPAADDNFEASLFDRKVERAKVEEEKIYILGSRSSGTTGTATLSGLVKDGANGESIPGVSIFTQDPFIGTATDVLGKYTLTLPKGKRVITIQSIGMKTTQRTVILYDDGKLDVELEEEITPLKEVIVNSEHEVSVTGLQMGKEKMDLRTIRQMPLALGEADVMKVVLALPGVQSVGEGSNGLNVRGGASNQNLILFNGATIYNPSHLFGFFSTFNPDVLKSVELYKSGLEASLGGRLSSVLDVKVREGNLKKINITGGLSPITGRLTFEGPIIKDRTSFLLSGRSTYSDWILKRLDSRQLNKSNASFYDLNLNVGHKIDDNTHLTLTGYASHDQFKLNSDTLYQYSDKNLAVKLFRRFSSRLFGELLVTGSNYDFSMSSDQNPVNAFTLKYNVKQYQAKTDFSFLWTEKNTLQAGLTSTLYKLRPGSFVPKGDSSLIISDILESEKGVESAAYLGNQYEVSPQLSVYLGIRYSLFSYLGPKSSFVYNPQLPIEETSIIDTVAHPKGTIKSYYGPEPRFSARYMINPHSSVKLSYGRTRQYIQMLSNNTAIAPTDIWKLSDSYIKPQVADQISVGWFKNFQKGVFEFSAEGYYKWITAATDFQNGATLLRNHHLETDVLNARGKAYGTEFMIRKMAGRLNGWISYTWSRSFLQAKSSFTVETVNNGTYYPSNFDKPHALNLVSNYKFNRRINVSFNLTYSTGRPITLPLAKFELGGTSRLEYSNRNSFRIPNYFRSDISINIEGNHKIKKLAHSSWTIAVYNLTGRRNAYSVFYKSEGGQIKGYKLSVFGQAIPTITYNFKI